MLLPMLYFAWRYPLRGNAERLTDLGKLSQYGGAEFALWMGGMLLLFGLYTLALRETRRLPARRALPAVFGTGAGLGVTMVLMYPVSAIDIYIYAVHARLFTRYGVNPMSAFPKDYPQDAWLPLASRQWAQYESPYGPLWNLVAAPITWLAGDSIVIAVIGFKLLALFCLLVCGWAIARSLEDVGAPNAATGALFFLWNPLVLWEGVGNGHNDLLMTLPLLLALLAWAKRRDLLVIPLVLTAALIKFVPAILLPLVAIGLWRRAPDWPARARLVSGSLLLSLLVVAVAGYPFYDLPAIRTSLAHHSEIFRISPGAVAIQLLRGHMSMADVKTWSKVVGAICVAIALLWQSARVWFQPERLPRALFEATFVFLVVARWNFNAWYLIWPVGLAALLPLGWPAWRTVAWTAGALAYYPLFSWIDRFWPTPFATRQTIAVMVSVAPPLLLTLAELAHRMQLRLRQSRYT